jgi:hypothetical protein
MVDAIIEKYGTYPKQEIYPGAYLGGVKRRYVHIIETTDGVRDKQIPIDEFYRVFIRGLKPLDFFIGPWKDIDLYVENPGVKKQKSKHLFTYSPRSKKPNFF